MVKRVRPSLSIATVVAAASAVFVTAVPIAAAQPSAGSQHAAINCAKSSGMCTEVADSDEVFGHYVGHDEPSMLFYSNGQWVRKPPALQHHAADGPIGEQPEPAGQVLPVRAQRGRLARHGHLRHPVVPGAGEDLPAGQRQQHPRPRGLPQARRPGLHGDAVLPARAGSQWPTWQVAVGASSCEPDPVVRRDEHRQPVAQPGDRPGEQPDVPGQGRRGVPSTSRSSPRTAVARPRRTRSTRRPQDLHARAVQETCS